MCALMFGSITGVAEGLETAGMLANVGLLSGVAAQVDLQVLQTGKCLIAAFKLQENTQAYIHMREKAKNHACTCACKL